MSSSAVNSLSRPTKRVQIIASLAAIALVLLLGSLVLATRPHGVTALPSQGPQSTCVPVATNGHGYVPATGSGC